MKFIRNNHYALIKCRVKSEKDSVDKVFEFYPETKDKYNGQYTHTGYTEISDAELNLLRLHSKVFTQSVENKRLLIRDDVPSNMKSPAQMISALKRQIADLTRENEDLKKIVASIAENGDVANGKKGKEKDQKGKEKDQKVKDSADESTNE